MKHSTLEVDPIETARLLGHHDAQRGHTANPYGYKPLAEAWVEGYDEAFNDGLAELPRFGTRARPRNRRGL